MLTKNLYSSKLPGNHDINVLDKCDGEFKISSGIKHFGFRLVDLTHIKELIVQIEDAGGKIKESGEFWPGEPYVFFYDPDGYEIEVWYEKPLEGFN